MNFKIIIMICAVLLPAAAGAQGISETSVVGKEMNVKIVDREMSHEIFPEFTTDATNTANEIRVLTAPEEVQIVKLGERRATEDEKVEEALIQERENIDVLRKSIQINAILMDVLDAQKIGIPEVVGAKFTGDKKIEIYAFAAHDQ